MERWEKLQISKQMQALQQRQLAGTLGREIKAGVEMAFFGYYHVTKERTNGTFHNGPE